MKSRPTRFTRTTHSVPTRRSSDLRGVARRLHRDIAEIQPGRKRAFALKRLEYIEQMPAIGVEKRLQCAAQSRRSRKSGEPLTHHLPRRSEEHTSELQSLMRISYTVFCLNKQNNYLQQHHCI